MLRARAREHARAARPGADLQQLEAEDVVERQTRERALVAQHAHSEGALEPVAGALAARRFQASFLHENTSEVPMLQVKYSRQCQTILRIFACARCAHFPITISGSSTRRWRPAAVAVVDPGDAAPVFAELHRSGASLAAILLTHHHADHIGGVEALLAAGPVPVSGSR